MKSRDKREPNCILCKFGFRQHLEVVYSYLILGTQGHCSKHEVQLVININNALMLILLRLFTTKVDIQ